MRDGGKLYENRFKDTIIGKFSTIDQKDNRQYSYKLVDGFGDDDNNYFELNGGYLILKHAQIMRQNQFIISDYNQLMIQVYL